ncbi:MAG: DNA gyrase inhibitor YacG [Pseudomonadales bacterium]
MNEETTPGEEPIPRIVTCPTCNDRVKWTAGNPYRPFCSERCRLIDLGAWAAESHRIPGGSTEDEVFSGTSEGAEDRSTND